MFLGSTVNCRASSIIRCNTPKKQAAPSEQPARRHKLKSPLYYWGFATPVRLAATGAACPAPFGFIDCAPGALCCTPIAAPETTNSTRLFSARPEEVELSAIGLLFP